MRIRVISSNLMAPAGPFFAWGDRADRLGELFGRLKPVLRLNASDHWPVVADIQTS